MFAEDLLRDLRRDGFSLSAIATYIRRIVARVVQRLPRHPELVRSVAATATAYALGLPNFRRGRFARERHRAVVPGGREPK